MSGDHAEEYLNRVERAADDECPDWSDAAYGYLLGYPEKYFMCEDLRAYAESQGLPAPSEPRAWGAVVARACRNKDIDAVGYEACKNPRSHKRPARVWKHAD